MVGVDSDGVLGTEGRDEIECNAAIEFVEMDDEDTVDAEVDEEDWNAGNGND